MRGYFTNSNSGNVSSSDVSVTASKVPAGETYLGSDTNDEIGTGTAPTITDATYNVSTSNRTIDAGTYVAGTQTIKGVAVSATIQASNIKKGVTVKVGDDADDDRLVGVTGTYTQVSAGQNPVVAGAMLSGYSGFANGGDEVQGNITTRSDSGNVTLNASTTSKSYASGYYSSAHGAQITTQTKTVTANGTVSPDSGKLLSSVTVAIPVYVYA